MHKEQGRVVESATEARGGFLGRPVLVVLLASLILLCALYAVLYFANFLV